MSVALGPLTLEGRSVRLEPLRRDHASALLEAAQDGSIWEWLSYDLRTLPEVSRWVDAALAAQERGDEYPFAVIWKSDGGVIGSTRYMDVQPANRGCEIGWSWYAREHQGTVVNPESKYLLLRHAFEDWGAIRVALKTDVRNVHSQNAIRKLGAKQEGILRNHRIRRDGSYRDTMMFSLIASDWPAAKANLEQRIAEAG